jgi:hypothetical protein
LSSLGIFARHCVQGVFYGEDSILLPFPGQALSSAGKFAAKDVPLAV